MFYVALLFFDDQEFMSISRNKDKAIKTLFDGFNVYIMKKIELNSNKKIVTHEFLESELNKFYLRNFNNKLSIRTLEDFIEVITSKDGECYKNGKSIPLRVQDF